MNIQLINAGKKYGPHWIFRRFSIEFSEGKKYVILGPNGSGKSTLLKIVSGGSTLSEGTIEYFLNQKKIKAEEVFRYVSVAAPWLDIPEEYSLEELLVFHTQFKKLVNNITVKDAMKIIGLEHTGEKLYRAFSSGMKQRVKLALAILTDAPLLLLDEPITALDNKAIEWYKAMINTYAKDKTVVVFSNSREEEYAFCSEQIEIGAK